MEHEQIDEQQLADAEKELEQVIQMLNPETRLWMQKFKTPRENFSSIEKAEEDSDSEDEDE